MFFVYALPALIFMAFVVLYASILRRPKPVSNGIRAVIPRVKNVHYEDLTAEFAELRWNWELSGVVRYSAGKEDSRIRHERLQWLIREVRAMKSNVRLYEAGGYWELAQIKDKKPENYNDRDCVVCMILKTAPECLLALATLEAQLVLVSALSYTSMFARPLDKRLIGALEFASREYAELTSLALTVAHSYGRVHYENLICAL